MRKKNTGARLNSLPPGSRTYLWAVAACVLAGILANTACNYIRYYEFANYDSSPELVLASILAKENALFTRSWFYSTEIRVLNTQIVNMLLMKLFSSWRTVKTLSVFLHLLLLEGAYFFFARQFREHWRTLLLGAVILLLPRNWDYVLYTLAGEFYIPHLLILFLALALFHRARESEQRRTKLLCLALELVLAVLAGMGGLRQLEMTYLPLAASVVFCMDLEEQQGRRAAKDLTHAGLVLAASGVGYLINAKVLAARYLFASYGGTSLAYISFSRMEELLRELVISWGYDGAAGLFSVRGILGLLGIAAAAAAALLGLHVLARSIRQKLDLPYIEKQILLFTLFSWGINLMIFIFTDIGYDARYFIPQNTMTIVSVLILLPYCKREYRVLAASFFSVFLLLSSALGAKIWLTEADVSEAEFREAVAYVEERGYTVGYVHPAKNLVPELTDGRIDIYLTQELDTMAPDKWLMKPELLELPSYTGKTFMILYQEDYAEAKDYPHIRLGEIGLRNEKYVVLEYENNAEMWALVPPEA